jgi:uncharacterized membrane protein YqgA involved in biofilm formation
MTGTLINVATVLVGSALGTVLGNRLPEKVRETVVHGLGLTTLVIGLSLALKTQNILIALASILLGGISGELLDIEAALERLGRWLEARSSRLKVPGAGLAEEAANPASRTTNFVRGFLTASLVFCVGPMTIMGSIQDGLTGDFTLLAIKSTMDGFAALAFASSLGWGVMFSALTVLFYQGAITLGAGWLKAALTDPMINEMTAVGGILMLGIGLGLLEIKRIRVGNLLPALFIAPLIVTLAAWLGR